MKEARKEYIRIIHLNLGIRYLILTILLLILPLRCNAQSLVLEFEEWSPMYPSGEFHWNDSYSYISIFGDNIHWGLGELSGYFKADRIDVNEHIIRLSGFDSKGHEVVIEYNKSNDLAVVYFIKKPVYIYRNIKGRGDPCKITLKQKLT